MNVIVEMSTKIDLAVIEKGKEIKEMQSKLLKCYNLVIEKPKESSLDEVIKDIN